MWRALSPAYGQFWHRRSVGAPPPLDRVRPPVHTRRAGLAAATWTRSAETVGRHTFGAGPGGAAAAKVRAHELLNSNKGAYANKWRNSVGLCEASGYPSLLTTTAVVACWVEELHELGTVAPGTLRHYLTPISSVLALYNKDKPAVGPMPIAVRHGFACLYADNHEGLHNKRARLPAAALLRIVKLGVTTPDPTPLRRIAGLTLTALTFCRPGGGAILRRMDVKVATSHSSK